MVAFATATFAAVDSTKTTKKVKELSTKEYTIIAGTDTITAKPGDSVNVQFTEADSAKFTGKKDVQMIGGKATKVKEVTAHGKKFWVKADQDLAEPITMLCDEDEQSDPVNPIFYGLIGLVALAGGWSIWRFGFRG